MHLSTVDVFLHLDVRELARAPGFPAGGWPEARAEGSSWSLAPDAPGLVAEVVAAEDVEDVASVLIRHDGSEYGVVLEFEPCHLGGARPWFRCPVPECDRRCAVLYLRGSSYACRKCQQLRYPSQREDAFKRACRRRDRILMRLGCETGPVPARASKPPRMHWRTFERLLARDQQADEKVLRLMMAIAAKLQTAR